MIRRGLSSVSFRNAPAERIINFALHAGLEGIEWTGDTHVPQGNYKIAESLMMSTLRAGLTISAYGSFFRLINKTDYTPVLKTAQCLQAPSVRVWAGPKGTKGTVDMAKNIADRSGRYGITVCLEPHRKSIVDDYESLFTLVSEVNHPFFKVCWAPIPDKDFTTAVSHGIHGESYIHMIHARNWDSCYKRKSLEYEQPSLEKAIKLLTINAQNAPLDYWTLLEYLDEECETVLEREALSLDTLVSRYKERTATKPKDS